MKESQWIEIILDSPALSKKLLRLYMKSQSARNYTQILDDYFIEYAESYEGTPDVKKVLEDWLDVVSINKEKTKECIDEFFRYKTPKQKTEIIEMFDDSMHNTQHTTTVFIKNNISCLLGDSHAKIQEDVNKLTEYLSPLDEYRVVEYSVKAKNKKSTEYRFKIVIENHSSITKEHIKEMIADISDNSILEGYEV